MKRATLRFNSDSGAEYLYDDITGNIFPWGPVEEAVLKRELGAPLSEPDEKSLQAAGNAERDAKTNFIRRWRSQYLAFARSSEDLPVPSSEQVKQLVQSNGMVLVLVVTENCNLQCRYCVFASGTYTYHRKQTNRKMSFETATKAVDWFVECMSPQMARNPRKKFGLTFYGGEPLLNINLIKNVLEYVEQKYKGLFVPVLTTNGVLLTIENVKILADHKVHVGVSIDGPEEEHDRLRVDIQEKGTFKRIIANLAQIKEKYPKFWADLMSLSVYDPKSDIVKIAQFFEDNKELIPSSGFVNTVQGLNTEYHKQFKQEDYDLLHQRMHFLREKYKKLKIGGKKAGSYHSAITSHPLLHMMLRTRVDDYNNPFIPYTGCCIPGFRMSINVDGKVDMCERVNGTFPIGHLDEGGLNYERIAQLIHQYQEKILHKCSGCPVTRLCSLCFSTSETNGGVAEPVGFCDGTLRQVRNNLADYISMMEANNNLEFDFKSTILETAKNRIFQY